MIADRGPNSIRALVLSGILALTLATVGSAGAQNNNPQRGPNSASTQRLAKEVRHELILLPFYTVFDNLQYSVTGDDVTLSGQVTNPTVKADALTAVKGIEGVGKITDNIEVLPVSPLDEQIRRAEYRSIYGFPSLQRYSYGTVAQIHIIVKNGHVTLVGVVDNQADKDTAGVRANSVPNVFSVMNDLQISHS